MTSDEYSAGVSARARNAPSGTSRRTRIAYFGMASMWGLAVGVTGVLVGLRASGMSDSPGWGMLLAVLPAAGIAIAGAGVIAGAYEEAKRRRRGR